MLDGVLIDGQAGGNDVGTCHRAVHDLLGGADGRADDLGLAVEAVVLIDIHDVFDVLLAVLTVGLFPAQERRNEEGAVLCGPDGLCRAEHQRHVGADALFLQAAGSSHTSLGAGDLDDEVLADGGDFLCGGDHLFGVVQMGVDLHGDGELLVALQALFLDPVGNVGNGRQERLAAQHDVAGVGGNAVNAKGVVSELDLIEFCAVQEVLHNHFLLLVKSVNQFVLQASNRFLFEIRHFLSNFKSHPVENL